MLQDILPHVYHNEFSNKEPAPEDTALVFQNNCVLASEVNGVLTLPTVRQLQQAIAPSAQSHHLFCIDTAYYYLLLDCPIEPFGPWSYIPSTAYRNLHPQELAFACAAAESLHRWLEANRFCGHCGARMEKSRVERALVCPVCHQTVYPKICPAVIVAVTDGDRLLLTQYAGRTYQRYALVAGYAEIGEGIEDTVRREVHEEVGLKVKDLRFYKSQPWVLSDTLLMGFFVRLDGSSEIKLQEEELALAHWFQREQIPSDYSGISLTGEMIELFRQGRDPFSVQ